MFEFIYKKRIDELKKIQKRQSELYKEQKKYEVFPHPTMKKYHPWLENFQQTDLELLSDDFTYLFSGVISFEAFQGKMLNYCPFENKVEYFETLGKFFLRLSGNLEELEKIKKELAELKVKETKLKEQLGIK